VEEEEPSEGEPELCLMGIIVKKREREKRKKENGRMREGVGHCEPKRTPLCIQPNPDHDEKVLNNIFPVIPRKIRNERGNIGS